MTSEQARDHLESKGYHAFVENGVVMIKSEDRNDFDVVLSILKKIGYDCSAGWKKEVSVQPKS